jgi:3-dehydroquinate synthase
LLAQADSAIGGKTAIDAAGQKNLVGTFHHPSLVIADPALLDTLDDRQLRSGYAEVVKYGLIDNPAFFEWCEANCAGLLHGNREIRQAAIDYCVRTKTRFITADPDDTAGQRALLNFGHTFGHAIEAVAGHSVLHGEAIAVGMALAFGLSAVIGHCPTRDVDRLVAHLKAAGLPASLEDLSLSARAASVFEAMQSDKKSGRRGLALILTKGIGKAFVTRDVEQQQLRAFLA